MKQVNTKVISGNSKVLAYIGILIGVILYFVCRSYVIIFNSSNELMVNIGRFETDKATICGLLTQAQVMILVCLVVLFGKRGHVVSMCLCTLSVFIHLFPMIFLGGKIISVIGMMMIIGAAIINIIIYQYGKKMNGQKEKLKELAAVDPLTGLWNRRSVIAALNQLIEKKDITNFKVIFIDVDNFKKINDTLGHQYGDKLLMQIANCWRKILHTEDFLARLGGDEFALIIERDMSNQEIEAYINELRLGLWNNLYDETRRMSVTASFGVSSYPEDGDTSEQLLKYADTAMYMAKAKGKDRLYFFSQEMYAQIIRRMKLEEALDHVIENEELYLMYQPQYTCQSKKLRGFEVLLRWQSKEWGFISPAEFIPIAEETGKIIQIGTWVLEAACRQFKTIMKDYQTTSILSVNISVVQLLDPNFMDIVRKILRDTEFEPQCLEFEITESIFISSKEYMINVLNQLKAMGIHIALDDFGTHYASLSYIQMLPLDVLKIDKSFIDQIKAEQKESTIIGPIISIAQQLNYEVVAEGIEKEEQIEYLNQMGCDFIQGYLWGRPLAQEDVILLLKELNKELKEA